ncbi:MAG: TonB-dependent receptor domain-containing protein [Opitutales bacterium]
MRLRHIITPMTGLTCLLTAGQLALQAEPEPPVRELAPLKQRETIVATRQPASLLEVPGMISQWTAEELDRLMADDLQDLLAWEPGVYASGGPRGTGQVPIIRGSTADQVMVRIDGARQQFQTGHDGRFFIEPMFLQTVEIVRGPLSGLYGSKAQGGVVAFETLRPDDVLRGDSASGGFVRTGWDSASNGLAAGTVAAHRFGNWTGMAGVVRRDTGNLSLSSGETLADSGYAVWAGLARVQVQPTEDLLVDISSLPYRKRETTPNNPSNIETDSLVDRSIDTLPFRVQADWQPPENDWVDARITLWRNLDRVEETARDTGRLTRSELETFGIDIQNVSRLPFSGPEQVLTVGFEAFRDEQDGFETQSQLGGPGGDRPAFPDGTADNLGVFVQHTTQLTEALRLELGMRYDAFAVDSEGESAPDKDAWSPRASVFYRVNPHLALFATGSSAFTAPSIGQLFRGGPHFTIPRVGTNRFVPNPALEAETVDQGEVGLLWTHRSLLRPDDSLALRVVGFRIDGSDTIIQRVEGLTFFPRPSAGVTLIENADRTRREGAEFALDYSTGPWLAQLAGSTMTGRQLEADERLDSTPGDTLTAHLAFRPTREADWLVGVRARWVGSRVGKTESPEAGTSGYDLYSIYGAYTLPEGIVPGRATFGLTLDNAFDQEHEIVNTATPGIGRNLRVSLDWAF